MHKIAGMTETSEASAPRIVVYTRVGCHLCTDALAVVARVSEQTGTGFMQVDIDSDPLLVERYSEYVPVVLVDGVQQGFWRISEDRLLRLVADS